MVQQYDSHYKRRCNKLKITMNIKKLVFSRKTSTNIEVPEGVGVQSLQTVYKLSNRCSNTISSEYNAYMFQNQYEFLKDLRTQGEMDALAFYSQIGFGNLINYVIDTSFSGVLLVKPERLVRDPITGIWVSKPPLVTSNDIRFTVLQGRIIEAYKCN